MKGAPTPSPPSKPNLKPCMEPLLLQLVTTRTA